MLLPQTEGGIFPEAPRLPNLRLMAVLVTLVAALFLSPLSGALSLFVPPLLAASLADGCVFLLFVLALALLTVNGSLPLPRPAMMDWLMLIWLAFGGVCAYRTLELNGSWMATAVSLRYLFLIPVLYFLFRLLIRSQRETYNVLALYLVFLKMALAYTLLEFVAVNFFDMADTLSALWSRGGETLRFFDPIAGLWLKPAGPIAGSQNASFLALIAFFLFLAERQIKGAGNRVWLFLAVVIFAVSISGTAVMAAAGLILTSRLRLLKKIPKVAGRILFFTACAALVFFRGPLYSLRDRGNFKSKNYEQLIKTTERAAATTWKAASDFPWGHGWPGPQVFDGKTAAYVIKKAPEEIYIFRLSYYVGSFFVLFLLALHAYLFVLSRRRWVTSEQRFVGTAVHIVTCALIVSTIHYETFTRFGFSYFYAFCLACVPHLNPGHSAEVSG